MDNGIVKSVMIVKLSLVLPLHNEEKYLAYTLPSLIQIARDFDEVLIVLDNCSDRTPEIIYNMARYWPSVYVEEMPGHKMKYYASECFNHGFNMCEGDILTTWAGDLIYDPRVKEVINQKFIDPMLGTLCYRYRNFNPFQLSIRLHGHYENLYRDLIERVRREARHTGVYSIRRETWEELGPFPDIISEYDYFCHRVRASRWTLGYEPGTKIQHLRPGLTASKQYSQGTARAYLPGYNFIKTFFHSFIHFKPHLLTGYQHAKHYNIVDTGALSHE